MIRVALWKDALYTDIQFPSVNALLEVLSDSVQNHVAKIINLPIRCHFIVSSSKYLAIRKKVSGLHILCFCSQRNSNLFLILSTKVSLQDSGLLFWLKKALLGLLAAQQCCLLCFQLWSFYSSEPCQSKELQKKTVTGYQTQLIFFLVIIETSLRLHFIERLDATVKLSKFLQS